MRKPGKLPSDFCGRKHVVDSSGCNRVPRHAAKTSRVFILGECDSALGFDGPNAHTAVGCIAGQNHSDGPAPLHMRERTEEDVNRQVQTWFSLCKPETSVLQLHARVRRNDEDAVRFDLDAVMDGFNGQS
jgi:hypothetical protein